MSITTEQELATVVPTTPMEDDDSPKVFVGNLSFKTKDEDLIAFFEPVGKATHAKVITIRSKSARRRSAGYGFVSFPTLEDATKAAEQMDKKELDGREVNVQVARPKKQKEPKQPKQSVPAANDDDEKATDDDDKPAKKKKSRARRSKGKKTADKDGEEAETKDEDASNEESEEVKDGKKKRAPRAPRVKKELGEPSKTTLFITNLAYAATDDHLKDVFQTYKVQSTYVARSKTGRSRGYGFVEFDSEEEQLKALEAIKDVEVEGRKIHLKIARSERHQPEDNGAATDAPQENGHVADQAVEAAA
ncbi:hypothetical protein BC940DRAFT_304636 [Gongronella butleri]|nr:hypothetical protein BC940DRAFT_304636 [Gongronella butleri]